MAQLLQMINIGILNLFYSVDDIFFASLYVLLIAIMVVQELKDPKHLAVYHWTYNSIIDNDWQLLKLTVLVVYFLQQLIVLWAFLPNRMIAPVKHKLHGNLLDTRAAFGFSPIKVLTG